MILYCAYVICIYNPMFGSNEKLQYISILLSKTTAAQNENALSYLRVRGLYFLAVVFGQL